VRAERGRKKKLIVAFHFQFANEAAWKCDECRKNGLELTRRCDWVPEAALTSQRVVWAREQVATTSCPISYITAESRALLEEFHAWKLFGSADYQRMSARVAEAIFVLESELIKERRSEHEAN